MYSKLKGIKIAGIAAAVSNNWVSLKETSDENVQVVDKFVKTTGVMGHWAASIKQTTSDFCYAAAERLIAEKGIKKSEIGVLVFVTQSSDYELPATGCLLQHRLGLSESCIAFDVNLGCSGFVYGVEIAGAILQNTESEYALLMVGDTSAREKSAKKKQKLSHSFSMLFGDSGTATLLKKDQAAKSIPVSLSTDGEGYKAIIRPYRGWRNPDVPDGVDGWSRMDDIAVFNFANTEASAQILDYMEQTDTKPDDYDCLVLHQANMMILKRIAKKTGFSAEKNLISIDRFGNTSSASIPITLVDHYGELNEDKMIYALCCGFGIGLSWATAALELNVKDILPLVHTDDYFEDGYGEA